MRMLVLSMRHGILPDRHMGYCQNPTRNSILAGDNVVSMDIDTRSVDYSLLGRLGNLISNLTRHRDSRTYGITGYSPLQERQAP